MRVTVVGGGNVGTQLAVHFAASGHDVTVATSRPWRFSRELSIVNREGSLMLSGRISGATTDDVDAFAEAEVILVTVPAFGMSGVAARILPFANPKMFIGLIPGAGGAECAFASCIDAGATVFGLQRVPSVARLVEYGKIVCCEGYRDELRLASLPGAEAANIAHLIGEVLAMPCSTLPNYLCVSLAPSNPILHTCRLRTLFKDYSPGMVYRSIPLFYEEWDDASSELLLACDDELQDVCAALPELDLALVRSLREHYESRTVTQMTEKISGISSLAGLETPSVSLGEGYLPDFSSRYFSADFPYGLALIVQVARLTGVHAPHIEDVLAWYLRAVPGAHIAFRYADYGITNREELLAFYDR